MAITFVSEASGTEAGAQGDVSVNLPTGLQEDDIVLAVMGCDASIDGDGLQTGWTTIEMSTSASPGRQIMYKRMGATPDTTATLTTHSTRYICYMFQAFRGVDATTAEDTTFQTNATLDPPSITTVTDGALVIAAMAQDDDETTVTGWPTGYTNQLEQNTVNEADNFGATIAMSSKIVTTAAAENPSTYSTAVPDTQATWTVALRPAAEAGGTNLQLNIGDAWKSVDGVQINIGDAWKTVAGMQINIGDAWKTIY